MSDSFEERCGRNRTVSRLRADLQTAGSRPVLRDVMLYGEAHPRKIDERLEQIGKGGRS